MESIPNYEQKLHSVFRRIDVRRIVHISFSGKPDSYAGVDLHGSVAGKHKIWQAFLCRSFRAGSRLSVRHALHMERHLHRSKNSE